MCETICHDERRIEKKREKEKGREKERKYGNMIGGNHVDSLTLILTNRVEPFLSLFC
jgi:hypothetical protein